MFSSANGQYSYLAPLSCDLQNQNRAAYLKPEIEHRVWAYLGGVARKHKMTAPQIGGCDDHIHALLMAPPVIAPSQIAQFLNRHSS